MKTLWTQEGRLRSARISQSILVVLMLLTNLLPAASLGSFAGVQTVAADDAGNTDVLLGQACMQDTAGFGLNCTANDVQLANAYNIDILDDGCAYPGDTVTFTADFEVLLTAQARHDVGIWFAQDGDPNGDGALTGTCSVGTPAYAPDPPWLDLDGTADDPDGLIQDTCGDINDDHNPLFPSITLTVVCLDEDNNGRLDLPNCTSWRQPGANDLCTTPLGAYPGAPSKCRCDNTFSVDIPVPGQIIVDKVTDPAGDPTSFDFSLTGPDDDLPTSFGLTDLDEPYASPGLDMGLYSVAETIPPGWDLTSATCDDGSPLEAIDVDRGETVTCTFTNTRHTGQLEVIKDLIPDDDPGLFDLQIDGVTEFPDASDGDTTGKQTRYTGIHTVGEVAGTGTSLGEFDSAIECTDQTGAVVASSSDSGPLDVPVGLDDDIVCVITNTRNAGQLEVVKDLNPFDDPGLFDLQIDGVTEFTDASDGDTTGKQTIDPGTHSVGEVSGTGTSLADYESSIECTDQTGAVVANSSDSGPLDVDVDSNDDIVCTITNSRQSGQLEVVKDLIPDGDPGLFDLQIDGVTEFDDASDGDTTGKQTVDPDTHTVGEVAGTGTSLGDYTSSIQCTDQTGAVVASSSDSGPLDVDVGSNDDIVCTITNSRDAGLLEVVKALVPDNDPGLFDLQIDSVTEFADASDGDTTGKQTVDPVTHLVGEFSGTGTSLGDYTSSIQCTDQTGAVVASSSNAGPISVPVDSNDDIVCTITNTRKGGQLEVVKDLIPGDDPGLFDLQIDGVTEFADASDGDTTGKQTVAPDTHTVGEVAGAGTSLGDYDSSIECTDQTGAVVASSSDSGPLDVDVDSNDDIVCTITNTRRPGQLEVVKDLNPFDDPGLFDLQIDGVTEFADASDGDTTGKQTVDPDTYTVGEVAGTGTSLGDYTSSIQCTDQTGAVVASSSDSGPLDVDVDSNDDIVCTITNTRNGGQLEVIKDLIPGDDPGLFDLQIDGITEYPDASDGDTTGKKTVDPDTHTVGEVAGTSTSLGDYDSSIECTDQTGAVVASSSDSGPLDVDVDSNDDIVCTITNTRRPGQLEVVKDLEPFDDPGLFDLQIDGVTEFADASDGDTTGKQTVDPDTHTVGEVAGTGTSLGDYDSAIECRDQTGALVASSSDSGPLDVDVDSNDDIVCTITNTRRSGQLEVVKDLEPFDDPGLFDLQIDGVTEYPNASDGDTTGKKTVDPDTHTVGEVAGTGTSLGDYDSSIECTDQTGAVVASSSDSGPLDVDVDSNDDIVCTITNTRRPGQLEVVKDLNPFDDPGLFDLQIDGVTEFADASDGDSTGKQTVDPDTHTVGEVAGTGTSLGDYDSAIECTDQTGAVVASSSDSGPLDVDVDSNDDIVCTITNTRRPGQLEVVKDLNPFDDPGLFDLQIDGVTEFADASDGDTTGKQTVDPDTHTVGEVAGTGTSLGDYDSAIECRDQTGALVASSSDSGPLDVDVDSNDDIVCTITNTRQQGSIELKKVWEGTPGTTTLKIGTAAGTSNVDSELVSGSDGTTGANTVNTGTYYVSETDPGPYDTDLDCTKNGAAYTPGASDSVLVGKDDVVVCTYTNTRDEGSIELKKEWVGTPGSTTLKIGTAAGTSNIDSEFVDGADGTTGANTVDTGTYYVSETDPGPYDTDLDCTKNGAPYTPGASDSVVVGKDDVVVCTYTNTRHQGSIELKKEWVGTPGSTTLQIGTSISGTDVDTELVDGADGTTGANTVDTGTYFVSETDPGPYDTDLACTKNGVTYIPGASGTVVVGKDDVMVCTYTNTRQTGQIQVWKNLEPDDDPGLFDLQIDGVTEKEDASEWDYTETKTVDTGTHTVGEVAGTDTSLDDYNSSIECKDQGTVVASGDGTGPLNVQVNANDDILCVILNERKTGELEVVKALLPEDDTGLFNLQIDGITDPDAVDVGDGGSTGKETVNTGVHTVGETPGTATTLDDYTVTISCRDKDDGTEIASGDGAGPLDVTVNEDDDIVCTVTNKSIYGKIIVEKQTDPEGAPLSFSFAGDAAGDLADGEQIVVDRLLPGSYDSTETLPGSACTGSPIPSVDYLGFGAVLEQGKQYVLKAPRADIESTFDNIGWLEQMGDSHYHGAMVQPAQDTNWSYQAWEVLSNWRQPFTMNSFMTSPIDTHSLGVFEAGVLVTAMALDHEDYIYEGHQRHAKLYLLENGQKEELGQLEIADPAWITVEVPRAGEVIIETHDTTIWWSTCESLDWNLISVECDDENSQGSVADQTAYFELEAAETVKCTFTNRKESAMLVEKQTEPDAEPARFTFSGDLSGDIADGSQLVRTEVEPGSYSATETVPANWKLMDIDCDDGNSSGDVGAKTANFQVEAGEIVKCTFDNKKLAASTEAISRVDERADDAEERVSSGAVTRSSVDLELGEDNGNPQIVGLRFPDLQVPQGAPIVAAYIEFSADETGSEQTDLEFFGQADDDAPKFQANDYDISSRPKTAASVVWPNVPAWTQVHARYDTTDLSPIIQEIVNRPGWSPGNALVIMISGSGRRTAESWDGDEPRAPRLHVLYGETGGCFSFATSVNPVGSGQVIASPPPNCQGGRYGADTDVTLTAQPGVDAGFTNWSGDATGTNATVTINMDGDKSVTANFETYGPLVYDSNEVDDDNAGSSSGNGNGVLDCGETIELQVTIGNQGTTPATGVAAALSSTDPYVTCSVVNSPYPDIPASGTAANSTAYVCTASDVTPSGHTATLGLDMSAAAGGPWADSFDLQVVCVGAGSVNATESQRSDDAEEKEGGSMALKSVDLELVEDRDTQTVGLRFPNIEIPQGATITSAYVTFHADETNDGETHLTFHGQAADDAATFDSVDTNITSRPTTAASVDWNNVPAWTTVHDAHDTPNLAPIIQEIVGRGGWVSGNSLAIIISGSGKRVAESYEGATGHGDMSLAPKLHIDYGPPGACYSLSTSADPAIGGNINADPGPNCAGGKYLDGTSVQLTAQAAAGNAFDHWTGALTGSTNPDSITMDADRSVTAHFVTSDVGPLAYQSHSIDDDATPPSNGDGDSIVDCGETIEISVNVNNQGADSATGVNATLSSSDAHLSCAAPSSGYPDITGGGSAANSTAFVCTVAGGTPDGHTITVDLDMTAAAGGPWSDSFDLQVTCEGGPPITLDVPVSLKTDDAEERETGGMALKSVDLELVEDRDTQTVGLRFQGISVPQGATVTEAYITFYADETDAGQTDLTFHGQAADNAPTFEAVDGNITGRPKTTASVDWNNVSPWTTVHAAHNTPNLAPIVQEIVNRSAWASGNSLVVIVSGSGKRVAESWDGANGHDDPGLAPTLHITYVGTP